MTGIYIFIFKGKTIKPLLRYRTTMLSEEDFIPGVTPSSLREPQRQQLCEINLITPCHNRIHAHARESTHVKTLLFDHSCKSSREKAFLCEPSGFPKTS